MPGFIATPYDPDLTDHEVRCLRLAADGLTVTESAARLHRGTETIKTHLGRARLKLGARNTTHAVVLAITADLI